MTSVYNFGAKLAEGEAGEAALDRFFDGVFAIRRATRDEQRHGIDRIWTPRNDDRLPLRVEYKTDTRAGQTHNAFIETVSVDTAGKPGWAFTSHADLLVYWVPPLGVAYLIRFPDLRERLAAWQARYPVRRIPNDGYHTHGLLVPLWELERLAEQVVCP